MLKVLRKQDYRQAKSWAIVELIHSKYEDVSRGYRPKGIIPDFWKEFDIDLSYERAWRAQEAALSMVRKSLRESYGLLARYGEALKIVNHRTHYNLEVEPDGHFKYVYMTLEAYIRWSLNFIRMILVVDVAHCKGKYKGIMLVAVSIDANK